MDPAMQTRRTIHFPMHFPILFTLVFALGLALACEPSSNEEARSQGKRPPNVVFILADDLGYGELGSYGQTRIRTPNLDRLATEGMRFTQAYSGAPVCAPSRAVLMTGKHSGRVAIRGNLPARDDAGEVVEGQHPLPAEEHTLAELFRERGYRTGAMGKWGLGPVGSEGDPNDQGFDVFFGYNCQRVAHSYYPPHLWSNHDRVTINEDPIPGHQKQPEGEVRAEDWCATNYAPDLIVEKALEFLDDSADEPFFLYLPFVEPHVAMQPPEEWVERYPEDWDDRPYRGQSGYLPHPRPRAGYAAMISDLDENVGLVLEKLDELGLRDDTLVIFTSDNGTTHPHRGDPVLGVGGVDAAFFDSTAGLRGFKGSVYEGGIRVPLIARWPGLVEPGTVNAQPTYFPDWYPTFAALLGDDTTSLDTDGIDIRPALLQGREDLARPPMVWVFPEYGGQVALRYPDGTKLVHQALHEKATDPAASKAHWELYDVVSDPNESSDLAEKDRATVGRAIEYLRAESRTNELFPVPIPEAPGFR